MIINYQLKKHTSNPRLNNVNPPHDSTEQLIQKVVDEKRSKQLVNAKAMALLSSYNISDHDNCLVFYLTENEPNIKNNKEAIEHWVKAELIERNIDELSMRFKLLLSCIDPTIDLSEF